MAVKHREMPGSHPGLHSRVGNSALFRFNRRVQFEFNPNPDAGPAGASVLVLNTRRVPVILVRNPRARRYTLRVRADGSARVTVPRGGSVADAWRFAGRHIGWLERQLQRLANRPAQVPHWTVGTEILFRGELVRIEAGTNGEAAFVRLGGELISVADMAADLRPAIECHLWWRADQELPPRVLELAATHQLTVSRVTVRNQRSRWGSCSRHGTISLNWRLIQAPASVRDYIILHELMHLRQMNHSIRFWREVERVCPDYRDAERWLNRHSGLLAGSRDF
jgi:predicted metal-dependent hydrolase